MELAQETPADGWEVEALFDLCFAPGREALSSYRLREGVDPVAPLCLVLRDGGPVAAAIRYWPVRIGGRPDPAEGPGAGRGAGRDAASGTGWDAASGTGWRAASGIGRGVERGREPGGAPGGAPGDTPPDRSADRSTDSPPHGPEAPAAPPGPAADTAAGGGPALLLGPVAVHPTRQGEGLGAWLLQDSLARARALGWTRVMLVGDAPYYARFGFARLADVVMPPPTNPARVLGHALIPGAWEGISGPVRRACTGGPVRSA